MLPPLPPGWFIVPFTQIPALWSVCVCVIADQPGRLPAAPAEQLRECFVLACVLQEIPPAALALGTALQAAFPGEQEMLWCTCGSMSPFPAQPHWPGWLLLHAMPCCIPCLCCQWLRGVQLHHSPSHSFPKKVLGSIPCRRATSSVACGKAAAKYVGLNPLLYHWRRSCIQTGPSLRCSGKLSEWIKSCKRPGL